MLPKIHKPGNPGRPIVSACNCPTSNTSAYLDSVMAPLVLVKQLPTYVKDSSHALQILESFSFTGSHRYLFTMDIRSLYTVIPNNDGLQALKYHLDLRPEQQPPTNTLVRLAELVLNLNCFDFDGNYYQQVGVWLWERKWGPTMRACLLATSRIKCLKNIEEKSQSCINVTSMTSLAPPLILDKISRTSYIFVQPIILLLSILLR